MTVSATTPATIHVDERPVRVAIVTGGSRGIGLAIARRLVDEGVGVAITGRDAAGVASAVEDLGGRPANVLGFVGDTVDAAHREEVVRVTAEELGRIDHLVNNAGAHLGDGPVVADDDEAFRRMLEANVVAPRAWVRAAAPELAAVGGSVVNVSSIAGVRGEPGLGLYGVSKAALLHLSAQLALELAPRVRVNAVAPGFTVTDGTQDVYARRGSELDDLYPLGRVAQADDVAVMVVALLAGPGRFVTGQTVVVDGGFTLTSPRGYDG